MSGWRVTHDIKAVEKAPLLPLDHDRVPTSMLKVAAGHHLFPRLDTLCHRILVGSPRHNHLTVVLVDHVQTLLCSYPTTNRAI